MARQPQHDGRAAEGPVTDVREAMIVAGGAGTRLRPLTRTTPKPLLPFCDAPFLAGVIRRLADVGVRRVLLVVGADPSPFRVLRGMVPDVEVVAVPEPAPLDTAGGVRSALEQVSGTFLVLNGDILTDVNLRAAIATHRRADAAATIVLTRVEDTSTFGVVVTEDGGRITRFVEKPAPGTLPGHDTVNAGTYVLEPEALEPFPPGRLSFERTVFPELLAAGERLQGHVGDGVWADLGTPERFLAGHRLALDGALQWPTLLDIPDRGDGARVHGAARVAATATLIPPVLLGPEATVGDKATVGPHVVVGRGGVVGAGATVRDSVLFAGCQVGPGSRVVGLIAGNRAVLGRQVTVCGDVAVGDGEQVPDGRTLVAGTRVPDTGGDDG